MAAIKGLLFFHEFVVAFFFGVAEGLDDFVDFGFVVVEEGEFEVGEGGDEFAHHGAVGGGGFGFVRAVGHGFYHFGEFCDGFYHGVLAFAGELGAFGHVFDAAELFVGIVHGFHLFTERGIVGKDGSGEDEGCGDEGGR
jgi:hypothetical protein